MTPGRFKSASSACDSATFLSLQSLNKEIVREIFLNNGLTILEKGSTLSDINLAKKSIFKAIKASPGSLDVWFALSIILRAEFIFKNTTSSKDVSKLNSVLSFISKSSDSHIQASRRLRNREKTVYLESIALWTRLLIAECMIWSKNDDEIDKAFEIIEGIKSKDSSIKIACLVLTARAFKTIGNEKNSIHFFKKACASSGSPSYCWEELASLYCEKDMFKAAELCLLKAVKASKGSLSCLAHSQLAILGLTVKNNSLASDSIAELNKLGAVDTSKFLQAILQFRGGNASKASKTLESVGDSVWKDWLNGLINI